MVAQLFGIAVTIVIAGWLWFNVVRPILEDYNIITSSSDAPAPPPARVAPHVGATGNSGGQPIATPGNAINPLLPGNDDAAFAAQLDACLRVIGSGKIGQTEAIEIVFGCKRSGKPDSLYARARAAVGARMGQKPAPEWERVSDARLERVG